MSPRARSSTSLREIARRTLVERGFDPDFPEELGPEVERIASTPVDRRREDRTGSPWISIDNDDSRDLDQLSCARALAGGAVLLQVAIADVAALVREGDAIDRHAVRNTTSIYTAGGTFPMLPEPLSTGRTSLNPDADREAVVVEMEIAPSGELGPTRVLLARVRNHAKLADDAVSAWLDGEAPAPSPLARLDGGKEQVRLQERAASALRRLRLRHGALDLDSGEPRPVFDGPAIVDFELVTKTRARLLIEDLMIAANGVVARFLERGGRMSIRRVVRSPERWPRIRAVAAGLGDGLPEEPDVAALSAFLERRRAIDPLRFPDLSLAVVKLLGSGSYEVERPGAGATNHFGLAARDYTHSTAPNRRYPDLITQRLVHDELAGTPSPYSADELEDLAAHCTRREDEAQRAERQIRKSAAALLLSRRCGERFEALVTGAAPKGTWVRLLQPPVEGKLVEGAEGVDVGDLVRVKLVSTDVERGLLDFARTDEPLLG